MGENLVWIPDAQDGFTVANVLARFKDALDVEVQGSREKRQVKIKEVEPMNPVSLDRVNDMSKLSHLNEPSVLHNLKQRYEADQIYTYSGLFLIAVNPYKRLPIYTNQIMDSHKNKRREDSEPHIYTISDNAYRQMVLNQKNQSMLITGESGAGKTENTKKVVQYLAHVAGSSGGQGELEQQLIQTNPLLEAFGNAKTKRNNNSSRFGKFIEIDFSNSGVIAGCVIQHYLLETTRVTGRNDGERSFHFFYQLCAANVLTQSKSLTVDDMDDVKEYHETIHAMKTIGLSDGEIDTICRITSGILHLGNVEFEGDKSSVKNEESLKLACEQLGINHELLSKAFTRPLFVTANETIETHVSSNQALFNRNSLIKSTYLRLFDWIVNKINLTLTSKQAVKNFIGVLDIAGFEIFEHNSFEQLCINFTNEKLQQFFNSHMFKKEQEEYLREKIEWKYIDFGLDLQPTIDLIEKPLGVMSILDSQCIMPNPTEQGLVNEIAKTQTSNKSFAMDKFSPIKFQISHYAGIVTYDVTEWLTKNIDPLNNDCKSVMQKSNNSLIGGLFPPETKINTKSRNTVATTYRSQLKSLLEVLESTEPHFVRCIVPNAVKSPGVIEPFNVLHQLRCNGVLEGIRISRKGYPGRIKYSDFNARYKLLNTRSKTTDPQKFSSEILSNIKFSETKQFKLGKTKVFLRAGQEAKIEEARDAKISQIINSAQAACRGAIGRNQHAKLVKQKVSAGVIQKNFRSLMKLKQQPWFRLMNASRNFWQNTGPDEIIVKGEMAERIAQLEEDLEQSKSETVQLKQQVELVRREQEKKELLLSTILNDQKNTKTKITSTNDNIKKAERDHRDIDSSIQHADLQTQTAVDLIQDLRERMAKRESERSDIENHIQELKNKLQSENEHVATLTDEMISIKTQIKGIEQDSKSVRDESDATKQKILEIKSDCRHIDERVKQLQNEFVTTARIRSERDAKIQQLQEQDQSSKSESNSFKKQNDQLNMDMNGLRISITATEEERNETNKELIEKTKANRLLTNKLNESERELADQSKKRISSEQISTELEFKLEDSKNNIQQYTQDVSESESLVQELQNQVTSLKIKLSTLQESNAQLQKQREALNNQYLSEKNELMQEIKSVQSQVDQSNKQSIDPSESERIQELIEITNDKLHKSTLELNKLSEAFKQTESSHQEKISELTRLESQYKSATSNIENDRSTLESLQQTQSNLLIEKKNLLEQVKESKLNSAHLESQVQSTQRQVDKINNKISRVESESQKYNKSDDELNQSQQLLREEINNEKKTQETLQQQLKDLRDEANAFHSECNAQQLQLDQFNANRKIFVDQYAQSKSDLNNEKNASAMLHKKITNAQVQSKKTSMQLDALLTDRIRLQDQLNELDGFVKDYDSSAGRFKVDRSSRSKSVQELKELVDSHSQEHLVKNSQLNTIKKELSRLDSKLQELQDEEMDRMDRQDDLDLILDDRQRKHQFLSDKLQFEIKQAQLAQDKLRDLTTLNESLKESSPAELQRTIESIKKQIRSKQESFEQFNYEFNKFKHSHQKFIRNKNSQIKKQSIIDNQLHDPLEPIRRDFESRIACEKEQIELERSNNKKHVLAGYELELMIQEAQTSIKNEIRTGDKLNAQKSSLIDMIEELKDEVVNVPALKAQVATERATLESKNKDFISEVNREKSKRSQVETDLHLAKVYREELFAQVEKQTLINNQTRIQLENNLQKNIATSKLELEAEQKASAEAQHSLSKLMRDIDELECDLADEIQSRQDMQELHQEIADRVVESQKQVHDVDLEIAKKQANVKLLERDCKENANRMPDLEREVRKLKRELENELIKIEKINAQIASQQDDEDGDEEMRDTSDHSDVEDGKNVDDGAAAVEESAIQEEADQQEPMVV
ncbi:hypothetical protein AKO1_008390 [Acrasis kona]|uniref:Myosin motor domain-containing protein n=1 Tax=Acrasis kona TaxID=1008807 RepID=A0AAW2YPQ3_9EUKA